MPRKAKYIFYILHHPSCSILPPSQDLYSTFQNFWCSVLCPRLRGTPKYYLRHYYEQFWRFLRSTSNKHRTSNVSKPTFESVDVLAYRGAYKTPPPLPHSLFLPISHTSSAFPKHDHRRHMFRSPAFPKNHPVPAMRVASPPSPSLPHTTQKLFP
jgi:hypothetical protein